MSLFSFNAQAQNSYGISPYPDLWYNSLDGLRLGIRVIGEEVGAFKEGPHQLDAGVWVGTNFPSNPVSYYFSLTEPIPAITDFAEEGSVQLISSIRTGFYRHRIQFNKRWQSGFNEDDYLKLSVYFSQEKMFSADYLAYPELWQMEAKSMIGFDVVRGHQLGKVKLYGSLEGNHNFAEASGNFTTLKGFLTQKLELTKSLTLRTKEYAGLNFGDTAPENRFFYSAPSFNEQLEHGASRAEGTVSTSWLESGSFQFSGQTTIRGYANLDYFALERTNSDPGAGIYSFFDRIVGFNVDLEVVNPIQKALKNSLAKNIVELRSYLFLDGAKGFGEFERAQREQSPDIVNFYTYDNSAKFSSGAGLQISFNIPDYLANDRGLFLRYEVPLWLSAPQEGDPNFKYRTLIGFGAIFSF